LIATYPLDRNKDWLDILSGIAQVIGVTAIITLILELYKNRRDEKSKTSPRIIIQNDFIVTDNVPEGCITALNESDDNALPQREELASDDQYREVYSMLRENPKKYVRISIKNDQQDYEGSAKQVQFKIKMIYHHATNDRLYIPKVIYCPRDNFVIPAGQTEYLFIRVGDINREGYDRLSIEFLDVQCENISRKSFRGKDIGFQEKSFTQRPMVVL